MPRLCLQSCLLTILLVLSQSPLISPNPLDLCYILKPLIPAKLYSLLADGL